MRRSRVIGARTIAMAQFRPGIYAGIGTAALALRDQLRSNDHFKVITFFIGRRNERTNVFQKILFQLADILAFAYLLLRKRIDIVHVHSVLAEGALFRDCVILALSKVLGVKGFIQYHGSKKSLLVSGNGIFRWLRDSAAASALKIGVMSTEESRSFSLMDECHGKIVIVKNPVIACNGGTAKQRARNLTRESHKLLFISRFDESKGIFDVIRALKYLKGQCEDVFLTLAGDGNEKSRAEELVFQLNLSERAKFVGWVSEEEARSLYNQSTLLVFPTYFYQEGFPMVILHALAAGLPIITTRYRAMADYLKEPDNCLFVSPRSPEELAAKISFLLKEKRLRAQMKANNVALSKEFSPERVAAEFEEIYRQILREVKN